MKTKLSSLLLTAVLLAGINVGLLNVRAQGTAFTYQGRLNTGTNSATGYYDLRFGLYDAVTAGNQQGVLLTNSAVAITNGSFTVTLDFGNQFPGASRWLELGVRTNGSGAFSTLVPRQAITPTPYAIYSANAGSATTAGTATSATSATTAASFSGSLSGDVTGTQGATVIGAVGGQSAANVASGVSLANAATGVNTPNTIVKRDGTGSFSAGGISSTNFTGNGAGLTNLNASQINFGTVPDLRLSTNVALLNTNQSFNGSNIFGGVVIATNVNNVLKGTLTGNLVGNAATATSAAGFSGLLSGDVTGTQGATVVGAVGGQTAANVAGGAVAASAATSLNTPSTIVKRDASGNFAAGIVTGSFSGNGGGLTNLNSTNLVGTVPLANLPAAVVTNGASGLNLTGTISGNGFGLTNLNALALSTNVALLNTNQVFVSSNTFAGVVVATNVNNVLKGTLTGSLVGNATTATTAAGFSGSLAGDVTGTQGATLVGAVGGQTAANVASGAVAANAATSLNTLNTIVKRDGSGNFAAGTVTGSFYGNGAGLTNLNSTNLLGTIPTAQLSGFIQLAQLPPAVVTNGASGVNITGAFTGNAYGLTNLNVALASDGVITLIGNFVMSASPGVGVSPSSVVTADVNGDGLVDLISANRNSGGAGTVSVLTNNGSGVFVASGSFPVGNGPYAVAAADVNGDGYMDLITANFGINGNTLTVLTNDGTGNFVLSSSPTVGRNPAAVAPADINGDGKIDLISANFYNNSLTVLTNNGNALFTSNATYTVGGGPISVIAVDVNGDGKLDLISANDGLPFQGGNTLSVLTNNGSGRFALNATYSTGSGPRCVTATDVNGDGKIDVISANSGDSTLSVFTNNGHGGFVLSSTPGVGQFPYSVVAADINNDGKVDLISANSGDGTLTVLTNNGSGGFGVSTIVSVGSGLLSAPYCVAAADVNNDGKIDLISANSADNTLSVLLNTAVFRGAVQGDGSGLSNVPVSAISGGITTNVVVGGVTLVFSNGILINVQ